MGLVINTGFSVLHIYIYIYIYISVSFHLPSNPCLRFCLYSYISSFTPTGNTVNTLCYLPSPDVWFGLVLISALCRVC
jgi:hypothetical protein